MKTMKTRRHTCKRLLSVLVALAMCIGMFQSVAFAGELPEDGNTAEENGDMAVEFLVVNTDDADDAEDAEVPEDTESAEDTEAAEVPEDTENIEDTENAEDTEDAGDAEVPEVPEDTENKVNTDDVETILPEEPGESEEPDDAETPDETEKPGETGSWDMKDTERPEQSGTVSVGTGTDEDNKPADGAVDPNLGNNWEIFYDKENDVYKLTFNIDEDAKGEQVIDMTYALELLNKYAQAGSAELEEEKNKVQKPEMGTLPEEPKMDDIGEAPVPPTSDVPMPEPPKEPSKPEGLDEALSTFQDKVFEDDSILGNKNSALEYLDSLGYDKNDAYTKEYAQFMLDAADNAKGKNVIATGEPAGYFNFLVEYLTPSGTWDEDGNRITYTAEQRRQMAADYLEKNTPTAPEFKVDEATQNAYDAALEQYEIALKEYEETYGKESPEYQEFLKAQAAYEAAKAEAEAAYEQAMEEYTARKAEIEQKYANDKAAYDAAIKALEEQFKNRTEADVLQPGDVRKFQIFLTSSSKHTYKYKEGSFTLATPEWEKKPGGTTGFDGQDIPDDYLQNDMPLYVNGSMAPLYEVFTDVMTDIFMENRFDNYKSDLMGEGLTAEEAESKAREQIAKDVEKVIKLNLRECDLEDFLYCTEGTLANKVWGIPNSGFEAAVLDRLGVEDGKASDAVVNYILNYYSTDDVKYESLDELFKKCPQALTELINSSNQGIGKPWTYDGESLKYTAGKETQYNYFYEHLLSFAYGDSADIDEILGNFKQMSDGRFEYDNDSWTDNGLKNALYYYMAHEEIWEKTDSYFQQLLEGGLKADQATWTAFMMALNIDGELTSNNWQDTKWPWYNSIKLEQADGDFKLSKVEMVDKVDENGNVVTDENGNAVQEAQTITDSEAKFQLWTIEDRIINEETQEKVPVKMYCTRDEDGNFYFTEVESILETTKGDLEILYTLMQDTVYYLQEVEAPKCDQVDEDGTTYEYQKDPKIYVIMDESKCDVSLEECIQRNDAAFSKTSPDGEWTQTGAHEGGYGYLGALTDDGDRKSVV